MSVPEQGKKTIHQVVKVNHGAIETRYLLITNIALTLVLLLTIIYTINIVSNQEETIL